MSIFKKKRMKAPEWFVEAWDWRQTEKAKIDKEGADLFSSSEYQSLKADVLSGKKSVIDILKFAQEKKNPLSGDMLLKANMTFSMLMHNQEYCWSKLRLEMAPGEFYKASEIKYDEKSKSIIIVRERS